MRKKRIVLGLIGLGVGLFVLDYWLYPRLVQASGPVVNRGENGIWLRYSWYFGNYQSSDLSALADRLSRHGISEAFFHVRSVDVNGRLVYRLPQQSKRLNRDFHRLAPRVRKIAWIYAGNSQGAGKVDLRSFQVRSRMVSEAVWLVRECGFDGVEWDYEMCPDGDANFLTLLEETRAKLPTGASLEAAIPTWYPAPLSSQGWSPAYFGEVAKRCDGVQVMAYDSAMYSPRLYVWWVLHQVSVVTKAVAATNPHCRVLMGVPTYKDGTLSHNPQAENLRLALIGVRDGLSEADLSVWQGVSLFADHTTDEADWREFDRLWPVGR